MTTLERLYAEALELSDHDRAILADLLFGSTQAAQDELSPAWRAEVARRIADMEAHPERSIRVEEAWPQLFGEAW